MTTTKENEWQSDSEKNVDEPSTTESSSSYYTTSTATSGRGSVVDGALTLLSSHLNPCYRCRPNRFCGRECHELARTSIHLKRVIKSVAQGESDWEEPKTIKEMSAIIKELKNFQALKLESARAEFLLGMIYMDGMGVQKDAKEALRWFKISADRGLPQAETRLALMYRDGEGCVPSDRKAITYFRRAAQQGVSEATYNIAAYAKTGNGLPKVRKNLRVYERMAQKALQQHRGNGHAATAVACLEMRKSREWRKAEMGLRDSRSNNRTNDGDDENHMALAQSRLEMHARRGARLFRDAAAVGYHRGQYNAALLYLRGDTTAGVERDEDRGRDLMSKAAEKGHPRAMFLMGKWCWQEAVQNLEESRKEYRARLLLQQQQQPKDDDEGGGRQSQCSSPSVRAAGISFFKRGRRRRSQKGRGLEAITGKAPLIEPTVFNDPVFLVKSKAAVQWWQRAVDAHHDGQSYALLGLAWEHGHGGFESNMKEAMRCYHLAIDNGFEPARESLKRVRIPATKQTIGTTSTLPSVLSSVASSDSLISSSLPS